MIPLRLVTKVYGERYNCLVHRARLLFLWSLLFFICWCHFPYFSFSSASLTCPSWCIVSSCMRTRWKYERCAFCCLCVVLLWWRVLLVSGACCLVHFCMSRVVLHFILTRWTGCGRPKYGPALQLFGFGSWLCVLIVCNSCDVKVGIKRLASLQILCAVLWQQSGNVRAWLSALLPVLVAPQLSLDPPLNQVTAEEN